MSSITARSLVAAALVLSGSSACNSNPSKSSAQATSDNGSSAATPAQAPTDKTPDACSLLTDVEAGAFLGGPANHKDEGPRDASNGNGVKVTEHRCSYRLVTSDQLGHEIYVAVYEAADRAYFDDTGTKTGNEPIAGLGEGAKGLANHVYVFNKGTMLQIYGSIPEGKTLQDVARLAIAKL
ncbi:MAG: hypothetical protein JWO36_2769 [Myxococcales bacterium]|nr:hypothetical protein [Myxococcales bacterium]